MSRTLVVLLLIAWPASVRGQTYLCELRGTLQGQLLKGMCRADADTIEMALQVSGDRGTRWVGTITRGPARNEIEIVDTPYSAGVRKVLRSAIEWVLTSGWAESDSTLSFRFGVGELAPPTEDDLVILLRAREIIVGGEWDRADDRNCDNDVAARVSLYCALANATKERMGRYYHRQPALRLVRELVAARWPERLRGHRLMDFNNHQVTSLEEVLDVLSAALERARIEVANPGGA